jgi:hypothetical protein
MTLQAFIAADELWTSGAGLVENVEDSSPHGVNPGQLERFATTNPANIGVVIKKNRPRMMRVDAVELKTGH